MRMGSRATNWSGVSDERTFSGVPRRMCESISQESSQKVVVEVRDHLFSEFLHCGQTEAGIIWQPCTLSVVG